MGSRCLGGSWPRRGAPLPYAHRRDTPALALGHAGRAARGLELDLGLRAGLAAVCYCKKHCYPLPRSSVLCLLSSRFRTEDKGQAAKADSCQTQKQKRPPAQAVGRSRLATRRRYFCFRRRPRRAPPTRSNRPEVGSGAPPLSPPPPLPAVIVPLPVNLELSAENVPDEVAGGV